MSIRPLTVDIFDGEITVKGFWSSSQPISADAAREMARQLVEAANFIDTQRRYTSR
ncbi:hypothetical protein KX816_07360 [Sphingosinicellaceae bacterium]|nr:hypothetical protein KX816_07360 [Sphingosinicellaceae bacterium]